MASTTTYFVDRTIPGLGGADFVAKAGDAIFSTVHTIGEGVSAFRTRRQLRNGLRGLDRNQLRDLGLDRNAC